MKQTLVILFIISFCGCNNGKKEILKKESFSNKVLENETPHKYFNIVSHNSKFNLIVEKHYNGSYDIGCFGIGYNVLIGKPQNSELPKKLTVLYHSKQSYDFKKGERIIIVPDKKQDYEKESIGIIYITNDTIINGKSETYVLGSENKSIWAERIEK